MPAARCILCERTGAWAIALRPPLQRTGHRVYETRSLETCWDEILASPASIVGVQVTAENLEQVVSWMCRLRTVFSAVRVIVLGDRGLESCQGLLREVGAVHAVFSPREVQGVVRVIQRHLGAAPDQGASERERVWQRLPWADAGESPV
jgi:DNA-binding response OmpR family regulator